MQAAPAIPLYKPKLLHKAIMLSSPDAITHQPHAGLHVQLVVEKLSVHHMSRNTSAHFLSGGMKGMVC